MPSWSWPVTTGEAGCWVFVFRSIGKRVCTPLVAFYPSSSSLPSHELLGTSSQSESFGIHKSPAVQRMPAPSQLPRDTLAHSSGPAGGVCPAPGCRHCPSSSHHGHRPGRQHTDTACRLLSRGPQPPAPLPPPASPRPRDQRGTPSGLSPSTAAPAPRPQRLLQVAGLWAARFLCSVCRPEEGRVSGRREEPAARLQEPHALSCFSGVKAKGEAVGVTGRCPA